MARTQPRTILDVGCGRGELVCELFPLAHDEMNVQCIGIDVSEEEVRAAQSRSLQQRFLAASVYALPFPDASFDLVLACEVLEHLEHPARGLAEIHRVCRHHVLLSVPWEPVWRFLNVLRGKYLTAFGNTPGHLQWFSRRDIRELMESRFTIIAERRPLPWTMLLAEPRKAVA